MFFKLTLILSMKSSIVSVDHVFSRVCHVLFKKCNLEVDMKQRIKLTSVSNACHRAYFKDLEWTVVKANLKKSKADWK